MWLLYGTASARPELPSDWRAIRLLAEVPAGAPREALEHAEDEIAVPSEWVRGRVDVFAVRVVGESMFPHIREGDIVAVRAVPVAESGQVVVVDADDVADRGGQVKRFKRDPEGQPWLYSDNPAYPPRPMKEGARVAGVVVGLIRGPKAF